MQPAGNLRAATLEAGGAIGALTLLRVLVLDLRSCPDPPIQTYSAATLPAQHTIPLSNMATHALKIRHRAGCFIGAWPRFPGIKVRYICSHARPAIQDNAAAGQHSTAAATGCMTKSRLQQTHHPGAAAGTCPPPAGLAGSAAQQRHHFSIRTAGAVLVMPQDMPGDMGCPCSAGLMRKSSTACRLTEDHTSTRSVVPKISGTESTMLAAGQQLKFCQHKTSANMLHGVALQWEMLGLT